MTLTIVVNAKPQDVFIMSSTYSPSAPAGPAGGAVAAGQVAASEWGAREVVTSDSDVDDTDSDIIVVKNKIKDVGGDIIVTAVISGYPTNGAGTFSVPCIGSVSYGEIASILNQLTFNLTNKNYGPGRAGQNHAGEDGDAVPVELNASSAVDYNNNATNGIESPSDARNCACS